MSTDAKTVYEGSLRNTHAAEHQGLTQMKGQVNTLDEYPEYKALLQRHITTTESQLDRIERALEELGTSTSAFKEAVTSTVGAIGAAGHRMAQDATLKNLYAGYAYQYEQIGAYRSLAIIADRAGYAAHRSWIDQSIGEEERAAEEVKAIIEPVTRKYLDLTLNG